jgi:PRC-barrel domain
MATFDPATLDRWRSLAIVDRDGATVGTISEFYLDRETGHPTWALVDTGLFGATQTFVPLVHATEIGDGLQVPYEKRHIKDSPRVDPHDELTPDEEATLFAHYGVEYQPFPDSGAPVGQGAGMGSPQDSGVPSTEEPGTVPAEPGSVEEPSPVPAEPGSVEGPGPVPAEPGSVEDPGPVPAEPGAGEDPTALRADSGSAEGLGAVPPEPGPVEGAGSDRPEPSSRPGMGPVEAGSGPVEATGSVPPAAESLEVSSAGASDAESAEPPRADTSDAGSVDASAAGSVDEVRPATSGAPGAFPTGAPDDATLVVPGGLPPEHATDSSRPDTPESRPRDLGADPSQAPPADPTLSRTAPGEPGLPGATAAAPGPVPSTIDKGITGDPAARPAAGAHRAPDATTWPPPAPRSFDDQEPTGRPTGASDRWREAKLAAERDRIARAAAAQQEERSPLERARRRLERLVGVAQEDDDVSPTERDAAERARRARLGFEDDDPGGC